MVPVGARPRAGRRSRLRRRLDTELVRRGLVASRARAVDAINEGRVRVSGAPAASAARQVDGAEPIAVLPPPDEYVSRGGHKLAAALDAFAIDVRGMEALDVGSSTGGFTDVLLQRGAVHVVAVDVGRAQLDWKLRNDPRVAVLERVNARYLEPTQVPEPIGALVCDASFIGLRTVLPAPLALCAPGAWAVALIKPQFEVGPHIAKGGVVRDPAVHRAVCDRMAAWWAGLPGWRVLGVEPSPILGPEGNREFLIAVEKAA